VADGRDRSTEEREAARLQRDRERADRERADRERVSEASEVAEPPEPDEELFGENGHEHEDPFTDEHEVASGTRRMSRLSRVGAARPPRPPRQRTRKPYRPSRARAPHSRSGRIFSLFALLVAAALIWFLVELFQPFHGSGKGAVTVTIPPNSSSSQVGDLLSHDGVISSSFFFRLRATLAGDRGDLRAGTYHLKEGMSYGAVLSTLTTPPPAAKVSNLTIIEGRTRRQIDALLRSQKIGGSYLAETRHSRLLDPGAYGAPRSTSSLEGFLFPSTYQLRDPIRISDLVADQLQTFKQQFAKVKLGYAARRHLTAYDVLTIASMVQAEAETAHDRPLIASVIYNRLRLGMPLQIDASTRYATDNYTSPLTQPELNSRSPYNTRIHTGLPPTPIDNPGIAAIEAAAHPSETHYLYFVVKPCGNGEQAFASNYTDFLKEAAQYNNARIQNGGRSPSRC
jgi:peptidoglycan lytic transglycosylase G